MQDELAPHPDGKDPQATKVDEKQVVPEEPNAFADGSLKQSKGSCWQTGGAGVWHPERSEDDLNEEEQVQRLRSKRRRFDVVV